MTYEIIINGKLKAKPRQWDCMILFAKYENKEQDLFEVYEISKRKINGWRRNGRKRCYGDYVTKRIRIFHSPAGQLTFREN